MSIEYTAESNWIVGYHWTWAYTPRQRAEDERGEDERGNMEQQRHHPFPTDTMLQRQWSELIISKFCAIVRPQTFNLPNRSTIGINFSVARVASLFWWRKYTVLALEKSLTNDIAYLKPSLAAGFIGPHKSQWTNSSGLVARKSLCLLNDWVILPIVHTSHWKSSLHQLTQV